MHVSSTKRLTSIPLFPLPDFFLFPGAVVPLHIFEPRYRQMVDDLMDTAGRLVTASVRRQHAGQLAQSPPVFPVGGLGEIVHHKCLEDGRYLVWLLGLSRVSMDEIPSERLYRKVDAWVIPDRMGELEAQTGGFAGDFAGDFELGGPVRDGRDHDLLASLLKAVRSREARGVDIADDLPLGLLADLLLQNLDLRTDRLEYVFAERNVLRRAALALSWHREQQIREQQNREASSPDQL